MSMYYADKIVKEIRASEQIVVFGAGIVAYNVVNCLIRYPYQLTIEYCIVSDQQFNPKQVMGIPVIDLKKAEEVVRKNAIVLIAVTDKNLELIQNILYSHGFSHTISIAFHSDLWELIRGNYLREYCRIHRQLYMTLEEELEKIKLPLGIEERLSDIHIYVVKNHADKKLQEDVECLEWEMPIQAGTALTRERVCEICDNTGEHISDKNKEYCELTALYWIWKNDSSNYIGICHYRRHFKLDETMIKKLLISDIDVILTIPILNFPSVRAVYDNDHIIEDWDIMLQAIEKLEPAYRESAEVVQNGQYYSGYNMFVARKKIFHSYCEWLFPILAYCRQHCKKKVDIYQNRYIGFLAERLLSIYFVHHEKDYKIVYAKKHFTEK